MLKIKIGEVCDVYDGPHATPKKIDKGPVYLGIDAITDNGKLNPSGYNYLSEEDYKIWTKRVTPQYGDLVFSYEATLGRYALIPKDFYGCLGRRLAVVRPKDERINIKWLYYYFLSPEWSVYIANNTVKGSTVNRISIEDFPNFYIPLLERTEQDKIVKVLSAIDEKIDNNVNINDNLPYQLSMVA
ncbi:restriction endonuclease subunit S [Lachnospira eligens]|uniref:restriction endonuclease subunit S n=1 Tax=Lachnospira eligens TaxID=39485 RepID=UPI0018A07CF8|nr:restriction endonuclease subunit S [Lachnospira eligens]